MARIRVMLWTEVAAELSLSLNSARCDDLIGLTVCSGKCLMFIGG